MASTKRKTTKSVKERIEDYVTSIDLEVPNPGKKKGIDATLYEIFVWQTICKLSEARKEKAYEKAQPDLIPADDTMRALGKGDWIVTESSHFSLTAKVTDPRHTFDLELFLFKLNKEYKIPVPDLSELAGQCKVPGKAVLTKRVLEA